MAGNLIMVDTSILIDYYRKTDKNNSIWISLVRQGYEFSISAITKYEIYSGATQNQLNFWDEIIQSIFVFPFDENTVNTAVTINKDLKRKRKQIAIADLFIAASAVQYQIPFVTLNKKHFDRINSLTILD